jgi:TRAP-type C4-dicarboxylate transport system permease small subunit
LVFFILERIADIFASVIVLFLLFLFIYANYKIFKIAQSKRGDKRVAPATGTSMDENRKTRILNLKSISTLYLAVAVFSVVCARSLYIQVYIYHHQTRYCLRGNFCYFICGQTRLPL